MPNYANGKIYKITSGDKTYIGSTTAPTLAKRLAGHVKEYIQWKKGSKRFTTSFPLIESGQYEITLVELCPCGSKDELQARERFHIENNVCVNKRIEGRTPKESAKAYYENTYEMKKDILNERRRLRRKEKVRF